MTKTSRVLLPAAVALALAGHLYASPHHVVEAERADAPPAIDGDLADWEGAHWIRFSEGSPHTSAYGALLAGLRYDGPSEPPGTALTAADASARFAIEWDEDHIYLAADVTDNVHDVAGGSPITWYLKDAVALYLDIPNDDDGGEWIPGDHAFAFVADPTYPEYGCWWRRGGPEGSAESAAPPQTRYAVRFHEGGHHIEAAIPMAALTESTPAWQPPFEGREAGFFLLVTDPDGDDDVNSQIHYGGDSDNDANWATLAFVDERTVSPEPQGSGAGPALTRLHFRVSPDDQKRFSESFDAGLLPVLERHGFTPVDGPLTVAADSVYARLFSVPDLGRFWAQWADVELDPEWISGKVGLASFASHGLRVGQVAAQRGGRTAAARALRGVMRVYSVPASEGVVLPAGVGAARAVESSTVPAGVGIRQGNWWNLGVPDGFTSPEIRDIVQDEDGGLWLATELGVSHFDGARITNYGVSRGAAEEVVFDIDFSRDGNLWIARGMPVSAGPGGGISRFDGRDWHDYSTVDGLANTVAHVVTQDSRGRQWFGTLGGLSCVDGERVSIYTAEHGLACSIIGDILESADGAMWFATAGGLTRYDGARFTSYTWVDGLPDENLGALMQDSSGRIWAIAESGAAFFDGDIFRRFDTGDVGKLSTVAEDGFGNLWFGSYDDGLCRYDGDQFTSFGVDDGMLDQTVASIMQDREGHIWVGTREALSRYDGELMRTFTVDDGLPSNAIKRVLEDRHGHIWLATWGAGLTRYDGSRFVTFSTEDGLLDNRVSSLVEGADGTLWLGSESGLVSYDGHTFRTRASTEVWRLNQDRTGRLWINSPWAVATYDGARLEPLTSGEMPTNLMLLDGGLADADGDLWFTGQQQGQGGLIRFDGSGYRRLAVDGGLASRYNAMLATEEGTWFGGERGLSRLDGESFRTYTTRDGLTRDNVLKMARDERGRLWVASYGGGVDVFDGEVFQNLHRPDGLPSDTANDLLVAGDGAVWIATDNGVTRYRPGRLAPPIRITEVVADRSYGAADEVSLSSAQGRVSIEFRGTSLKGRANRVVYLYRLAGKEEVWHQTRETRVEYSELHSGDYTFEVVAVDVDLNRSARPAQVRLEVHPPYETLAWALSTVLALILIAFQTGRVVRRDRRLSAQNRQLEQARAAAETANEAKSAFLANMSHELRTPLNGILGYAQILGRDSGLSDQQRNGVNTIRRSGEHLLTLINDILDLSKIEAHRLDLEPGDFDLRQFIETLSEPVRMRADQEGLSFACQVDPSLPAGVRGDERKLRQVLLNLLSNAVKFTAEGSVSLTVDPVAERGSGVRFRVTDSGPGIPAEQFDRVFQPFEQLAEPGAVVQGTGLGLAISRELVALMGGELDLESEPGRGSTFTVTLSLPEAEGWVSPKKRPSRHPSGYRGKRRRVLVADDRPENRVVLLNMLAPLGFEVTEAADGEACLERLDQAGADIVLVDLVMPGTDGFEVMRRIRSCANTRDLPVIAVSASVYERHQELSREAGCSGFLAKPIDELLLLEMLQQHLDLEWTYAGDAEPTPELEQASAAPPAGELAALAAAASRGDIAVVRAEIDRLRGMGEEYAGYVERLAALARSFDMKGIVRMLGAVD